MGMEFALKSFVFTVCAVGLGSATGLVPFSPIDDYFTPNPEFCAKSPPNVCKSREAKSLERQMDVLEFEGSEGQWLLDFVMEDKFTQYMSYPGLQRLVGGLRNYIAGIRPPEVAWNEVLVIKGDETLWLQENAYLIAKEYFQYNQEDEDPYISPESETVSKLLFMCRHELVPDAKKHVGFSADFNGKEYPYLNDLRDDVLSGKVVAVMYWMPWCGACRQVHERRGWHGVAAELKHAPIIIGRFSCSLDHLWCRQASITAYPTFIVYDGKRQFQYQPGDYDSSSLIKWLQQVVPEVVSEATRQLESEDNELDEL